MASSKRKNGSGGMFPTMEACFVVPQVGVIIEAHRRNAQAMAEAMQCYMRGIQKAMLKQGEMVTRMVQDNVRIGESLVANSPEQRMQVQADFVTHVYKVSVESAKDVRAILTDAEKEMSGIVEARLVQGFKEMQSAFGQPARSAEPEARASE